MGKKMIYTRNDPKMQFKHPSSSLPGRRRIINSRMKLARMYLKTLTEEASDMSAPRAF